MKLRLMTCLMICFALLTCVAAIAQQDAAPAGSSQLQSNSAGANQDQVFRKIEGCLAYNGVSYVLAVVSNGPKQYRIVGGDVEALHGKIGHTVEIDGATGRNDPREMVMNWDRREATTGVGWYTISADYVRDVTSNCSYPGFEHPLSHVNMN